MSKIRTRIEPFGYKITEENNDEVMIEITEEDYAQSLKEGVDKEDALKPGKYNFVRGGFRKRHPDFDSAKAEIKVRACVYLDLKVLNFFKERAGLKEEELLEGASSLVNQILLEFMERENAKETLQEDLSLQLLENDQFIDEVARRVQEKLKDPAA